MVGNRCVAKPVMVLLNKTRTLRYARVYCGLFTMAASCVPKPHE